MDSIITCTNLSRNYQKGNNKVQALNDASFQIANNSFVSIIGKSGSGKSTLLNLLGGLDKASSGDILINGKNLAAFNRKELALHRRFTIGMIFQSFNLITSRTALENVTLALAFGGVPARKRKKAASELLQMVGLESRMHHKPVELSGGEAQRVAIARSLANNPQILLADEPTGNLDSSTSEEIMQLIIDLKEKYGKTIIMVTHDNEIAQKVSDHIIHLKDGAIINQIYN